MELLPEVLLYFDKKACMGLLYKMKQFSMAVTLKEQLAWIRHLTNHYKILKKNFKQPYFLD